MKLTLNAHDRLQRAPSILETQVDGETVLMSLESGQCYGLNRIASDLWRDLSTTTTPAELQDIYCARYKGDHATIRADVTRQLQDFLSEQLIQQAK